MAKVMLTHVSAVLEKQNGVVFHIGIDVHRKSHAVCMQKCRRHMLFLPLERLS
jgi:hypothetical protein